MTLPSLPDRGLATAPPAAWRALPAGWPTWWQDRGDGMASSPAPGEGDSPRGRFLMARRLRRRAVGRAVAWPAAGADPRWADVITVSAATRAQACRLLAGVWLGASGPDWSNWGTTRRRWALGLVSTAPFHPAFPAWRRRVADEPQRAAAWAWLELRPRMELGCPGLWARACPTASEAPSWAAAGDFEGLVAGGLATDDRSTVPSVTPADAARVLRMWRLCLQVAADEAPTHSRAVGDRG